MECHRRDLMRKVLVMALVKMCSVFTGFSSGDFVSEKGEKVDWCNAAFSVPGTADTFVLKVSQDDCDPNELRPYRANFMLVDFRYDKKFSTFKGYIQKVYPSEAAMNADPLDVPDDLRPDRSAKPSAPASK